MLLFLRRYEKDSASVAIEEVAAETKTIIASSPDVSYRSSRRSMMRRGNTSGLFFPYENDGECAIPSRWRLAFTSMFINSCVPWPI